MSTRKDNVDPFIEALQHDVPSSRAEARARARLLAAGVVVTAAVLKPGAAAAAGAAAGEVGLLAKLSAWSLGAKVCLASGVVVTAALPVAWIANRAVPRAEVSAAEVRASQRPAPALTEALRQQPTSMRGAPTPSEPESGKSGESGASHPRSPVLGAVPTVASTRGSERRLGAHLEDQSRKSSSVAAVRPRGLPSSAAFPSIEPTRVSDGTLVEETRLLNRAQSALRAENTPEAERWLREHARRFPRGQLSRERERELARLRGASTKRAASQAKE